MELWRVVSDSSTIAEPQLMIRRLVRRGELESTITFYEQMIGQSCALRFTYAEMGLALASVANVLIIAGDDQSLAPFRATDYTVLVSNLEEYAERARRLGAAIVEAPKDVPTGRNMVIHDPDGSLVEYVEHRPRPGAGTG